MRVRLTKDVVDRAAPGYLWDTELRGFGLRVGDQAKSYFVSYGTGRRHSSRRVTIGQHGRPWTVETARKEARRRMGVVADGADPAVERATERRTPSMAAFALRYVREVAVGDKKPSSTRADIGNLTRLLFADPASDEAQAFRSRLLTELEHRREDGPEPEGDWPGEGALRDGVLSAFGRLRLDKVGSEDVRAVKNANEKTPTGANRKLALLSHIFSTAEQWELRPQNSNPCKRVDHFSEMKRERFLSEEELARLGTALASAEALAKADKTPAEGAVDQVACDAIRLLVFTGCRMSEVLTLQWDQVDLEVGAMRLPETKESTPKTVVLNAPALRILAGRPKIEGNPFAFPGRRHGRHLTDIEHPWQRIRKAAGLDDVRLHDLRHGFASVAVAGGASLPIIGKLLGHSQPATTARYTHLLANLSSSPLRKVSGVVGRRLDRAMSGRATGKGSR